MSKFRLWVYPAADYDVWFAGLPYNQQPKVLKPLDKWAADENADEVFNLAMFNMTKGQDQYGATYGRTIQYVHTQKGDIGYGGTSEQITLTNGDKCSGYRTAINGGKIQGGLSYVKDSRNANGMTLGGDYFHVQAENCSERELAEYCEGFAWTMLLQDGGGSTGHWTKGGYWRAEGERPVASVACIRHKTANPKPVIIENVLTFASDAPSGGTQNEIDAVVLHHAAVEASARSVHGSHRDTNKWWGIGYHYYVEKHSNVIWRGRPEKFVGAHAGNAYNNHSIGICAEGNFETDKMDAQQQYLIEWLVNDIRRRYDIKEVIGHKDIAATACPGKHFPMSALSVVSKPEQPAPIPVNKAEDIIKSIEALLNELKNVL